MKVLAGDQRVTALIDGQKDRVQRLKEPRLSVEESRKEQGSTEDFTSGPSALALLSC